MIESRVRPRSSVWWQSLRTSASRRPSISSFLSTASELEKLTLGTGHSRGEARATRAERLSLERLVALDRAYPVIARLDNGNSVVVAGSSKTAEGVRVAVFDPLAGDGVLLLEAERFRERWTGEVIFAHRDYRLSDPDQPFRLRWFVPELLRQGRRFGTSRSAARPLRRRARRPDLLPARHRQGRHPRKHFHAIRVDVGRDARIAV